MSGERSRVVRTCILLLLLGSVAVICLLHFLDKTDAHVSNLSNKDWLVRSTAAAALAKSRSPAAFDALVKALDDQEARVRAPAAEALGQIGKSEAVAPLLSSLRDDDKNVGLAAGRALLALWPETGEAQRKRLLRDWYGRPWATFALKREGWSPTSTIEHLHAALGRTSLDEAVNLWGACRMDLLAEVQSNDPLETESALLTLGSLALADESIGREMRRDVMQKLVQKLQNRGTRAMADEYVATGWGIFRYTELYNCAEAWARKNDHWEASYLEYKFGDKQKGGAAARMLRATIANREFLSAKDLSELVQKALPVASPEGN